MHVYSNLPLDTRDYNDEVYLNSREAIIIKGVAYKIKILNFEKNNSMNTSVEEKFYFSNVNDVVLFCFSVVNKESFDELKEVGFCFI